jgi:hypothetical protein
VKTASLARLSALFGLVVLTGCSEQQVVAELRSLSGSEDAVFICRDQAGVGHPYADCPDRDRTDDDDDAKKLSVFALVSQTVTDEIAVIDVSRGKVVDVDPARPGYGFLRVGGRPISMAATPGGSATFVATADVGRNGIFALPTGCLGPAEGAQAERDLTSWPACRLPETPGEISVLIEPFAELPPAASPQAALDGSSCRVDDYGPDDTATDDAKQPNVCQGNLLGEGGGEGRRKLVVALPDSGELAVIDAQQLLNIEAGTFPDCTIEQRIKLAVDVPAGTTQVLPADLTGNLLEPGATCSEVSAPTAPQPGKRSPQPAGFGFADDRLYVADQAAPVIHVLDTTSVCGMAELAPLLPMSLREPGRVVTTRRVAVSPLTPAGQRFAYAIDAEDQPGASVMVFDVSPGATDRTPLVRSGSPELPGEKPDRLALGSSAKDVTFAYRDIPYVDPATGVAQFGNRCSPDPGTDVTSPGALARPSSDFQAGARPGLLRGLFGFILLTNGSIAVVDEDDFDADCRRPIEANQSSIEDFRGCKNDQEGVRFFTDSQEEGGKRLVTGEASCRVVEPHRFRSARLVINDAEVGVRAPALRDFPQLTLPAAAASSAAEDRPRLLAVPFADSQGATVHPDVFVGSTRYSTDQSAGDVVAVDPNGRASESLQTQNSVVLPPLEPRSYAAEDTVTLTYEGSYAGDSTSGFLTLAEADAAQVELVLTDSSRSFCGAGVYDLDSMTDYAGRELGLAEADAQAFAATHADFVQLTTALPRADDSYWKNARKKRSECLSQFGAQDAVPLLPARDLRIKSAFADRLVLEPSDPEVSVADVTDCFPESEQYRLRAGKQWILLHASGFRHDIVASGADSRCVRSCDPLRKWSKGRVFEISSTNEPGHCRPLDEEGNPLEEGDPLDLRVGCQEEGQVACVYDQGTPGASAGVQPTGSGTASACIFNGLNERFALYRGRLESVRDSVFTWRTTGGFAPLVMTLTSSSAVVAPQSIQFLQQPEQMAVVDGASLGLSLFSLDSFGIVKPSPFF